MKVCRTWFLLATAAIAACAGDETSVPDETSEPTVAQVAAPGDLTLRAARIEGGRIELAGGGAFETTSHGAAGAATRDADGAIAFGRGQLVERVREHRDGVEQTWTIPSRPDGELVLRVAPRGLDFLSGDGDGLLFAGAGGVTTRYGHGTWIDADGTRTPIESTWDPATAEIVLTVPAVVLETSAYPAVLDPVIGSENGTDAIVLSPGEGYQYKARVAVAGGTTAVIWDDQREHSYYQKPYGTRLNASGVVQDAYGIGIPVCSTFESCYSSELASDGTNYLLVYTRYGSGTQTDIWGHRVSPALVPIGTPFVISQGPNDQIEMDVSFNGTNFMVVWRDYRSGSATPGVRGARVSTTGVVLDSVDTGINFSAAAAIAGPPAVHCIGTTCLATWADERMGNRDVYAQRVNGSTGALVGGELVVSAAASDQWEPDVGGISDFLVAWQDTRSGSTYDLYAARVSTGGTVLDTAGIVVSDSSNYEQSPRVAQSATEQRVFYGSGGNIMYNRVSTAGAPLDGDGALVNTTYVQWYLDDAAHNGSSFIVVGGSYQKKTQQDIAMVSLGTPPALPTIINTAANGQTSPAVAAGSTNYLLAWADWRDGDLSIRAATANSSGVPSTTSIEIKRQSDTTGSEAYLQPYVDVAYGNSTYLVVWHDLYGYGTPLPQRGIWGQRVSSAGALVGLPFSIYTNTINTENNQRPSVASDGTNFYVVWEKYTGTTSEIWGARVTSAGAVSAAGAVSSGTGERTTPQVTFGGTNYFAVWRDARNETNGDVYGARINTSGVVQDSAGIAIDNTVGDYVYQPDVGSTGTNYMVVYQASWSMYRRVALSGSMVDPAPLQIDPFTSQYLPDVVGDATNGVYLITFLNGLDLAGKRFNAADGTALDSSVFTIQTSVNNQEAKAVAAGPAGAFLAVYDRFDNGATVNASRVKARFLSRLTNGTACTFGLDCTSGNCVDGVCCNTACSGGGSDCQACNLSGSSGTCTLLAATTECRASAGGCDLAENCTGSASACPTDAKRPNTYVCDAASSGSCETDSLCDGSSDSCPANGNQPMGTVCGPSAGLCDIEETCSGTSTFCPIDVRRPMGYVCDAGATGTCEADATCNGTAATCPANPADPVGTVCRSIAGPCDVQETCSGSSTACPTDAKRPNTYVCDAAVALCEEDALCDGALDTCPANPLSASTETCRPAAGLCDLAENCTGSSSSCPTNLYAGTETTCRPAVDECDSAEVCPGGTPSCPTTDMLQPNGTPCSDDDNCTVGDACQAGLCEPTGPAIVAMPDPVDFGPILVGEQSTLGVTVTNFAATTHSVTAADVNDPAFAADFPGGVSIPGFGNANVDVTFTPSAATAYDGILLFTVASCPDVQIDLAGVGQVAGVDVDPASHDFGDVATDGWDSQDFVVTNTGDADFEITTIVVDATASFTVTVAGNPLPRTLDPDETLTFSVEAHPPGVGPFSGEVEIATDIPPAPGQTIQVLLALNGVQGSGDAGMRPDAMTEIDAGANADGETTSVYACSTAPGTTAAWPAGLLLAALLLIRRRR